MTGPVVHPAPTVTRLQAGDVAPDLVHRLRAGAVVAAPDVGVVELAGPGAVASLQGLLTNDVEKVGDGGVVYGALLTPKGMIVVDGWAARVGARVRLTVPAEGREAALAIFSRSVPPRLATSTDRTAERGVLRMAGAHALAIAEAARIPVPGGAGRVVDGTLDGVELEVARATELGPFVLQLTAVPTALPGLLDRLVTAGATRAPAAVLELARVLAGWPRLASEVDEKTIPQEVRFDEIGGVSYTKGCYTGQETVSRLHFRGHANRQLLGLEFDTEPAAEERLPLVHDERELGRVTSVVWLPDSGPSGAAGGRWIGLGVMRRELRPGDQVTVGVGGGSGGSGGVHARVAALPFALPRLEPA